MAEVMEVKESIRHVLQEELPGDANGIGRAVERIMKIVDPFEKIAREELERYRDTFVELAK